MLRYNDKHAIHSVLCQGFLLNHFK